MVTVVFQESTAKKFRDREEEKEEEKTHCDLAGRLAFKKTDHSMSRSLPLSASATDAVDEATQSMSRSLPLSASATDAVDEATQRMLLCCW